MENLIDDLGPYALTLVGPIDNHIPNRRPVDKIREDASKSNQPLTVPSTNGEIRMLEHFFGVSQGSFLRPWRLTKESKKLRHFRKFVMRIADSRLEGWRHLILQYPSDRSEVYEETNVNASPYLS